MWEIKDRNGNVKATAYALEYNGEWMGECSVTVNINSHTPIDFQIGDWLEYRRERFEINYDPSRTKTASRGTTLDAFKYDSIKFNSLADELTRCDFLDIVTNGRDVHFTALPTFSFFAATIDELADRIAANLNRAYPNMWTVEVHPECSAKTDINISVDTIKVWDALAIATNDFGVYFTVRGRKITLGTPGVPAAHVFKYGKDNGLYEIAQAAESDQQIVTRLRAYGSMRNIPHRYYNSLSGADGVAYLPDNMAVRHLMLPDFPKTTQDPYLDSANKETLGVREGTVFFDGSGDLEEIYPSIEGITGARLKALGIAVNYDDAADEITSADQVTDNGIGEIDGTTSKLADADANFKVKIKDIGFDINDHLSAAGTAAISFKSGMLGGREFEIHKCTKGTDGYILELKRVYDDDLKLWFPYNKYNAKAGDKFVLLNIDMPSVYIDVASQRLKEAAIEWLSKNDYSRSIYEPKVDEIFMARQHDQAMESNGTIASLHDTLKEGMQMLFEDSDLCIEAAIIIDRLTIKEGDKAIPTYEVTLKEEKTVGALQKIQNKIDSLASGKGQGNGYNTSQIRALCEAYTKPLFLSKLVDDISEGKVSSKRGFGVCDNFGIPIGEMHLDGDGRSVLDIDRLNVRVKAFFEELAVTKASVLAGRQYITAGGGVTIVDVGRVGSDYACYFLRQSAADKTPADCLFVAGDMAICETFKPAEGTLQAVRNRRYWRLVKEVIAEYDENNGNTYGCIVLSADDCENGSDVPQTGDVICQLGHRNAIHRERQSAMVLSTVGSDAPSVKLYSGISSYNLTGCEVITYGYRPTDGGVYFRLGSNAANQYLDYTQERGLEIAGRLTTVGTNGNETPLDSIVVSTERLYYAHTSATIPPTDLPFVDATGQNPVRNDWSAIIPTRQDSQYIWSLDERTHADGTITYTTPICIQGLNGIDGASYTNNISTQTGKPYLRTAFLNKANDWNYTPYVTTGIKGGDTVTVSFDWEAEGLVFTTDSYIKLQFNNYNYAGLVITRANGKGRVVYTFTVRPTRGLTLTPDMDGVVCFRCAYISTEVEGGHFKVWNFKVELGENPTPVWTPAMADHDALQLTLSHESHTFPATASQVMETTTECAISAKRGTSSLKVSVGALICPSGMAASIIDNNTIAPRIVFRATQWLRETSGTIDIPLTIEDVQFVRRFSWSVVRNGQDGLPGEDGITPEVYTIALSDSSVTRSAAGVLTTASVTATKLVTIGTDTVPTSAHSLQGRLVTSDGAGGYITDPWHDIAHATSGRSSGTMAMTPNTEAVEFRLITYPEGVEIATVRVPVITTPADVSHLTDAIHRAESDSTDISGGLIMSTLMRLGATSADGSRNIAAGINGITDSTLPGGGLAAFFGGDMLDPAIPSVDNPCAAGIRHDGTAFFAGNLLRLNEDTVNLGDSLILDTDGLRLTDAEKNDTMRVGRYPIPAVDPATLSANHGGFLLNESGVSIPVTSVGVQKEFTVPSRVKSTGNYTTSPLELPAGAKIHITPSFSSEDSRVLRGGLSLILRRYASPSDANPTIVARQEFEVKHSQPLPYPLQIGGIGTFAVNTDGYYDILAVIHISDANCLDSDAPTDNDNVVGYLRISALALSKALPGTTFGNDGLASVWGDAGNGTPRSAMFLTPSAFLARVGRFGIHITDDALRLRLDGTWRTLTLGTDNTLKLT